MRWRACQMNIPSRCQITIDEDMSKPPTPRVRAVPVLKASYTEGESMKRLYLLRHGQTEFNVKKLVQGRCDSPLTDLGLQASGQPHGSKPTASSGKEWSLSIAGPSGHGSSSSHASFSRRR